MNELLSLDDVETLARDILIRAGTSRPNAAIAARSLRQAERDGQHAAGLGALPDIVEHLRCGRLNGQAVPALTQVTPSCLQVDAGDGFACPAIEAGWQPFLAAARRHGIAILTIRNAYPMTLPALVAENIAGAGLIGLCMATTRVSLADGADTALPRHMALALPGAGNPATILQDSATDGSVLAALIQTLATGALDEAARGDFTGPLGGPLRAGHALIAIAPEVLNTDLAAPQTCAHAVRRQETRSRSEATGIAIPARLLETIINA